MAAPSTWNGVLNANEILKSCYNMIINQQVYSDNIGRTFTSLVDRARVDGSLYGDTYLKYSTDALETFPYVPDSSNQLNLLATYRPEDPFVQAIVLDQPRFIPVTIDDYFSKRAFSTATAFADFNSVTLQWLSDTKKIYDATTYNAFVGTCETAEGKQTQTVDFGNTIIPAVSTTVDQEAYSRLIAEMIAQKLSDVFVELKDVSKSYNDLGYYRAINASDLEVVWNADWVSLIRKVGLPTIFNQGGLLEIKEENILPAKYFGAVNASSTGGGTGIMSLIEQTLGTGVNEHHYWPGEEIAAANTAPAGTSYTKTAAVLTAGSVICKIIHKNDIPYMSGYETETTFINGKNLSQNHYLHFAHNTLEHIHEFPLVTIKCAMTNS
jgi:hypothetical protein